MRTTATQVANHTKKFKDGSRMHIFTIASHCTSIKMKLFLSLITSYTTARLQRIFYSS